MAGLRALLPGVAIVSEEGDVEAAVAGAGTTYWLVDPLDGTKEFLRGLPEYTVNVALVEAGLPVLGRSTCPPRTAFISPLAGTERVGWTRGAKRASWQRPSRTPGGR